MTPAQETEARRVLIETLRTRRGRKQAITSQELSRVLHAGGIELGSRAVREFLSALEKQEGFPLLLGACGGDGYYIAETADDAVGRYDRWAQTRERLAMLMDAYARRAQREGLDLPHLTTQRNQRRAQRKEAA